MNETGTKVLPYGRHIIDDEDIEAVIEVLKSDWLTTGPKVDEFERALAAQLSAKEAVVCSSGSSALHLALLGLGIGPGDSVIVPSQTFVATANACRYVGAEVIFSDVDPETGLMNAESLTKAMSLSPNSDQVRAIFVVHLGGQCVELDVIAGIAEKSGITVIEDACHALGARFGQTIIGDCHYSSIAVFSFHPVKSICMGEGGALTLNNNTVANRLRSLRSHGITKQEKEFKNRENAFSENGNRNLWYYEMSELGYNFRATDIQCALGLSQLSKLNKFLSKRRELMEQYRKRLNPYVPFVRLRKDVSGVQSACHLAVVHIEFEKLGLIKADVIIGLQKEGIGSQVHYIPVHMQPYYTERYGKISLPGAEAYYSSCLSLPLHVGMTAEDVGKVVFKLTKVLGLKK